MKVTVFGENDDIDWLFKHRVFVQMAAGDSSKRSRPAVLATARSLMLDSIDNLAYGALFDRRR